MRIGTGIAPRPNEIGISLPGGIKITLGRACAQQPVLLQVLEGATKRRGQPSH